MARPTREFRRGTRKPPAIAAAIALLLAACSGATQDPPPKELNNTGSPATSNSVETERGKRIYVAYCASCHGVDGEGQANWKIPNENGLRPAPPHDASGHTWHHPDSLLLDIIADGSMFGPSNMPSFEGVLTNPEQRAVLSYIKSWWTVEQLEFQEELSARG